VHLNETPADVRGAGAASGQRAGGDSGEREGNANGVPSGSGLIHHEEHAQDRDGQGSNEGRRYVFSQHDDGQHHDEDGLGRPEKDRHARRDRRQADASQRVGDARVEDPEPAESAHLR
jgi:hypothetical protein